MWGTIGLWVIDGIAAVLVIAGTGYVVLSRRFDSRTIASRLEFRIASRRAERLLAKGHLHQAQVIILAILILLGEEARDGPLRHRAARAAELEQWKLADEQLRARLHSLTTPDAAVPGQPG